MRRLVLPIGMDMIWLDSWVESGGSETGGCVTSQVSIILMQGVSTGQFVLAAVVGALLPAAVCVGLWLHARSKRR